MDNGTEDFEKLRKLLKLKRYEQPPPGYFGRFSGLVITRIEREAESEGSWAEAPWLKKLLRIIESSPVVGGLFGSGLCALVIFGIAMANQADKTATGPFSPVASAGAGPGGKDFIASSGQPGVTGRSTDAMFGSNIIGSPFVADGSVTASLEPVSFIKPPQ
jgi:hypothetical protein